MTPLRTTALAALAALSAGCGHLGSTGEETTVSPPRPSPRATVRFTPVPDLEAAHVTDPHDYKGTTLCQRCHVAGEDRPSVDPVALCSQCHDPSRMRHPVGVPQPGGAQGLPLVGGSTIACHTCHDPHAVKAFPHGLRSDYVALCKRCHAGHGRAGQPVHGDPR